MIPECSTSMSRLRASQRSWALRHGLACDGDGYCLSHADNLLHGLSADAEREFARGGGGELGTAGQRGKLRALHSSAAFAYNWFEFWRHRSLGPLSEAVGTPSPFTHFVGLERKFSTGVGGPANLDVTLECEDGSLFCVESKYCEPYAPNDGKHALRPAYVAEGKNRWRAVGLPGAQQLADSLRDKNHAFSILDVAQLLKHLLALARCKRPAMLSCLWYDDESDCASQHRRELDLFARQVSSDAVGFRSQTYQTVFAALERQTGDTDAVEYLSYLRDRYIDPR